MINILEGTFKQVSTVILTIIVINNVIDSIDYAQMYIYPYIYENIYAYTGVNYTETQVYMSLIFDTVI
jgi:hypothetical protein